MVIVSVSVNHQKFSASFGASGLYSDVILPMTSGLYSNIILPMTFGLYSDVILPMTVSSYMYMLRCLNPTSSKQYDTYSDDI